MQVIYETVAKITKIPNIDTVELFIDGRWCMFGRIFFSTLPPGQPLPGQVFWYRIIERDDKTRYQEFSEYKLFDRIKDKLNCSFGKHTPKLRSTGIIDKVTQERFLFCKFCNKKYKA